MTDFFVPGKTVAKFTAALCIAASLTGCLEEKSESERAAVVQPQTSNTPPEINGIPAPSAQAGALYSFVPQANDADNDFLEFEVTNKPSWATFNTTTGTLQGTPGDG